MSFSFPLYDIFDKEAKEITSPLTQEQMKYTIDNIKSLNQDGADNLYLIIRYASSLVDDTDVFRAKYNRKGVVFNLEFLPDHTQKIVYAFVLKHMKEVQTPEIDIVFGQ